MRRPQTHNYDSYIGASIKFDYNNESEKVGVLVAIDRNYNPVIYLPNSTKHANGYHPLHNGIPFTWYCGWSEIEIIIIFNAQLEFNFMR